VIRLVALVDADDQLVGTFQERPYTRTRTPLKSVRVRSVPFSTLTA
jgi:hypothetical protein